MTKKIFINLSNKEEEELLINWIKEYSDINIIDLDQEISSLKQLKLHLEHKDIDIVILDNGSKEIFRELTSFFHNLKKAKQGLSPLLMALLSKDNLADIFSVVGEDIDILTLKPLEKEPFLLQFDEMLKEIELYPKEKVIVNINKIHFFLKMADYIDKEPFLRLCELLLNSYVLTKISPIIGEPTISFIVEKLKITMEKDYKDMPIIKFINNNFVLENVLDKKDKILSNIDSIERIHNWIAFYLHSFFKFIQILTSDILVGRPLDVLLVEDNPSDRETVEEALGKKASFRVKVNWVGDGVDAMQYLQRFGIYKNCILPDIILLDLNMPRKDGREVLDDLKKNPRLSQIPVVIITSCKEECALLKAKGLQFEYFMVKPVDERQFIDVIKSIKNERFDALRIMME